MLIIIEGSRNTGKGFHLHYYFTGPNKKEGLNYYKFYFADHYKTLGLQWVEDSPALHYFSLGNIMTIMEMNVRKELEKTFIFDRAIISAYTWAVLRKRLTFEKAKEEMVTLLKSDLYSNIHTVVLKHNTLGDAGRIKDAWDNTSNTEEWEIMQKLVEAGMPYLTDKAKGNSFQWFENDFSDQSKDDFAKTINAFDDSLNK